MNSRERVRTALEHQEPDRVPVDMWFTPEILERLQQHFGVKTETEVRDKLGLDVRWLWADYCGPELRSFPDGSRENYWGVRIRQVRNEYGVYDEIVEHPLEKVQSIAELEDYHWPSPEWFDYGGMSKRIAEVDGKEERWIGVGESAIFERAWALTGMEKFLVDLAMNPELPCYIMDKINDYYIEQTLRTIAVTNGHADMVYTGDDIGTQQGMLLSPEMWRKYIKPRQKKINDAIKNKYPHLKLHYHSCGSILPVIDDLIEIGVDVLNPIQVRAAGMQPAYLKAEFGNRLSFCGGIDIQDTLPHGTVDAVKKEVQERVKELGKGGGYILAPTHSIQPDTPLKNILAIVDTIKSTIK